MSDPIVRWIVLAASVLLVLAWLAGPAPEHSRAGVSRETATAIKRADAAVMDDALIRAWHLGYSAGYESGAGECVTLVTHGRQP